MFNSRPVDGSEGSHCELIHGCGTVVVAERLSLRCQALPASSNERTLDRSFSVPTSLDSRVDTATQDMS
jgi:hypothetical protein